MLVCDGFLLAWVLTELRNGLDPRDRRRPVPPGPSTRTDAGRLRWAVPWLCRGVMIATLVFLALQHLPTSVGATSLGRSIRWQLGWGLVDLQGASLVVLGSVGVVAWSRGSIGDALRGFKRLLEDQAGHLIVALAMAGVAAGLLVGLVYPLVLLLPPAGRSLPAADSYAHYVTLPVGLWTLAARLSWPNAHFPSLNRRGPLARARSEQRMAPSRCPGGSIRRGSRGSWSTPGGGRAADRKIGPRFACSMCDPLRTDDLQPHPDPNSRRRPGVHRKMR